MLLRPVVLIVLSQLLAAQTATKITLSRSIHNPADASFLAVTATVTPSGATGMVSFYDGSQVLGTGLISGGQALLVTGLTRGGAHLLRAQYQDDAAHSASSSAILPQVTNRGAMARPQTSVLRAAGNGPGPFLLSSLAGLAVQPTSMAGTAALLRGSHAPATDAAGNVYFADGNQVFRLDLAGILTRIAGTVTAGAVGANGPALNGQLDEPIGIAVDPGGNVYVADSQNGYIRRVSPDGIMTIIAGTGSCCADGGDGGPAIRAEVGDPTGLALDAAGNLYIADPASNRIRRIGLDGNITTVAGNGAAGYSGDGGPALLARLAGPWGVAVDRSGNLFIADSNNNCIRKVSANGKIATIAGNGTQGFSGDNGPALAAELSEPLGVTVDAAGDVLITDSGNSRVREVSLAGKITTLAGTGDSHFSGDGLAATTSISPTGVAADQVGNLFLADGNGRLLKLAGGMLITVAGGGSGNPAAASLAEFGAPGGIARDSAGNLYISDPDANRVYQIAPSGAFSTVAGNGTRGFSGDGGPATAAQLNRPTGLAVDSHDTLYIADTFNARIRKVMGGAISTAVGSDTAIYPGDGGVGGNAGLILVNGLAVDTADNLYIADVGGNRIRKLSKAGIVSTVAGTGIQGDLGNGGLAVNAQLNNPNGVATDSLGNLYITEPAAQLVRKVAPDGTIGIFAGTGLAGYGGDGGPSIAAQFNYPQYVAVDTFDNVYIGDMANDRIRVVTTDGNIATVAGGGNFPGDGGAAVPVFLGFPGALLADPAGILYFVDQTFCSVQRLTREQGPPVLSISGAHSGVYRIGSPAQYSLTVSNLALAGASGRTVIVTEFPSDGVTISSMSGAGWTCGVNACYRSDTLAPGASYPAIAVGLLLAASAPAQITNQATVFDGAAASGWQDTFALTAPPTTIQTTPPGLQISIDGQPAQTAPQTLTLVPGAHLVAIAPTQAGPAGTQYVFTGWSDSGAATHAIAVSASFPTFTASFKTQYQLTTAAIPSVGGAVTPASNFFDAQTVVSLTAAPNAPYTFNSWSGGASGNSNPGSITMTAAVSMLANFSVPGFSCDVNNDGSTTVADAQMMINEALGMASANHDLNRDGVVNVADVQKVINAALGMGCVY